MNADINETFFRVKKFYYSIQNNHAYDLPPGDGFWECLKLLMSILNYIDDDYLDVNVEKQTQLSKEIANNTDNANELLFLIGQSLGLDEAYDQIKKDINDICKKMNILRGE